MNKLSSAEMLSASAVRPPAPPSLRDDIQTLIAVLFRHLNLIVAVFAAVSLATFVFLMMQPSQYTATTTLSVGATDDNVVQEEQALTEAPLENRVDSEVEILRSEELLTRLVTRLKLAESPVWNRNAKPAAAASDKIDPRVLDRLTDAVSVRRRGQTAVVDVSVTARDPKEAARVANALIDEYFLFTSEARAQTATRASSWLEQRLEELRRDVVAKEATAQQYRAMSGLQTTAGVSLREQQVAEVQRAMLQARAELAQKQARLEQSRQLIRSGGSGDSIGVAMNSEVIRDLRQREVDLSRRQAEYESTLGVKHPSVAKGRAEIKDVQQRIASEIARLRDSLSNEVEVARASLSTLEASLAELQISLNADNEARIRLNELEREADAARSVYESFLRRFHEVTNQGQLQGSNVQVVSVAREPSERSSPRISVAFFLAVGLAGVLSLAAAVLIELIDDTVRGADQVESRIGARVLSSLPALPGRVLAHLPENERNPAGYVQRYPISAAAEAYRMLLSQISAWRAPDELRVSVAMSSALPGEGKTSSALALARVAALSGRSVLIIDADQRRRSLNDVLGITPQKGLLEVLAGDVPWRVAVVRDEGSGADFLPLAAAEGMSPNALNLQALRNLMNDVRAHYQMIVLDCPPVLGVAEARSIAALADCVVVIARVNKTPKRALESALEHLSLANAMIAGVAVNDVPMNAPGRSSYSDSLYYSRMRGYYLESDQMLKPRGFSVLGLLSGVKRKAQRPAA